MRPQPAARMAGIAAALVWKAEERLMASDRVPLLDRKLLDARDVLDAGVVDEDIDGPERLRRLLDEAAAFLRLRHVGANVFRLDAVF